VSEKVNLSADLDPEEIVSQLGSALERAGELLRVLQSRSPAQPARPSEDSGTREVAELIRRLDAAEADLTDLTDRLVETENQRGRLMSLYVATYQLHATLDLGEVKSTIGEIARDLLGAQKFVLLVREDEGEGCEIAMREGIEDADDAFSGDRYEGGDAMVDETLADGVLRVDGQDGSGTLAVVPLRVQGSVVGAIVLLKLFDHKPSLTPDDRDLLDLLAAHAASALFAARVYSRTDRKLRTLESLVKLVRKD
jgi:GAF domain-containing protein